MYPIEKYRYHETLTKDGRKKIIAISTYAGKTVRGVAICDKADEYSMNKGRELAAARCALKIADKRVKRAVTKTNEAESLLYEARDYLDRMDDYLSDSVAERDAAKTHLMSLIENF